MNTAIQSVTDTGRTGVTDIVDAVAADVRTDLVALLAVGVLRLAAERAGVERKRMRQPESRSQTPPVTPLISERYPYHSLPDKSVGVPRQDEAQPDGPAGRDAKRDPRRRRGGAEPERGAER